MPEGPPIATLFVDEVGPLRAEYLRLTREALPAAAGGRAGPIQLDHCFMRVVLDNLFGRPWTDVLDRRRGPAYRQLDAGRLRRAIELARSMLDGGLPAVRSLNDASLRLRAADQPPPTP